MYLIKEYTSISYHEGRSKIPEMKSPDDFKISVLATFWNYSLYSGHFGKVKCQNQA